MTAAASRCLQEPAAGLCGVAVGDGEEDSTEQGDGERPQANVHFVAPFSGDAPPTPTACSHAIR